MIEALGTDYKVRSLFNNYLIINVFFINYLTQTAL